MDRHQIAADQLHVNADRDPKDYAIREATQLQYGANAELSTLETVLRDDDQHHAADAVRDLITANENSFIEFVKKVVTP